MNQTTKESVTPISSSNALPVAFIQAMWHDNIVDQCYLGFEHHWQAQGLDKDRIQRFTVPGSFDIPLLAKRLASTGNYSAIVASGFVVDGGIYRHEFVASAVIDALMQIQLSTDVPVISAVLTPHQFQENEQHTQFFYDHFHVKGEEAARACLHILANFAAIEERAA